MYNSVMNTVGPTTLTLKEIPVPPKNIMMILDRDYGVHTSSSEYFFTPEEFLQFFKPLVEYYGQVENEQSQRRPETV